MATIRSVRGFHPQIGSDVFIAENATIIGDVRIGAGSSIWYNVVLRGDVMPIVIGENTNIQDGTVIHGTYQQAGAVIGNRVTVGHSVILHGCHVHDESLIGMGSILMDDSEIGEKSIVGAGALVTEKARFSPRSLILGRPAKFKRELTPEELAFLPQSVQNYMLYSSWYRS